MAVPKRHLSRPAATSVAAMFGSWRPPHWSSAAPQLSEAPHQACGNCGYYKGEEVIKKA